MTMELESLDPTKLIEPQKDVETIEQWAERNGVTSDTARAWVKKGVLPSVKLGKRHMVNCVMFGHHLLEQEWVA